MKRDLDEKEIDQISGGKKVTGYELGNSGTYSERPRGNNDEPTEFKGVPAKEADDITKN